MSPTRIPSSSVVRMRRAPRELLEHADLTTAPDGLGDPIEVLGVPAPPLPKASVPERHLQIDPEKPFRHPYDPPECRDAVEGGHLAHPTSCPDALGRQPLPPASDGEQSMSQSARHRFFVSYCHDGIDRPTLDYVVAVLRERFKSSADLLIDERLPVGGDFSQFMALLDAVDAVIIILTPQYKARVLQRQGGVYEEFTRIWNRYDSIRPERESPGRFAILPILFSGTHLDATPDEIRTIKHIDLTGLRVSQKPTGAFHLPDRQREKYDPLIKELAAAAAAAATVHSEPFRSLAESLYDRLFVDLKASYDDPTWTGHDYPDSIWVKTHAYTRIRNQQAYFVIGRKGSGKSTMTQILSVIEPGRYEGVVHIVAEGFDLETLYSLYSDAQFRSDVSSVVPRDRAFQFTWEALLMLATIENIVDTHDRSMMDAGQLQLVETLSRFMGELKDGHPNTAPVEWYASDYFSFAFDATVRFVRACIQNARDDPRYFQTDIGVRFKRVGYLEYVFGKEVLAAFRGTLATLPRRFLVTLDGLDRTFDQFRQSGVRVGESELTSRGFFEVDWLRSILGLVIDAKSDRQDLFFRRLDFCVAVPTDRFLEINRLERDNYRHSQRWCGLDWSGIELAICLRKRAEELSGYKTQDASPRMRLEEVLEQRPFSRLPKDLEFEYNGKHIVMPLFMYVLRHTFWRPREVLTYYADLVAFTERMARWNSPISAGSIRQCVKATTRRVIDTEFIGELQSTTGIRDIIMAFRRAPIVLGYPEVERRIVAVDFRFVIGDLQPNDIKAKIEFLYDTGFLGVRASPEMRNEFGLNSEDAFVFNEGQADLMAAADDEELRGWEFVIHPVFSEYLRLDTERRDLTLQFDWDYLSLGDARLATSPHPV